MGRRPRDKGWGDDPLVPIDGGRLAAALAKRKRTARDLARLARVPDNTIHYITMRERKRCRHSVRAAAAALLAYPVGWLAGELDLSDQYGQSQASLLHRRGLSTPRADLARHELLRAVAHRLAYARGGAHFSDDDKGRLNRVLRDLLDLRTWRDNLLGRAPRQRRDVRPEEMERAVPALAEALTVILAPWLRGDDVRLELDALRRLLPRRARQPAFTLEASPSAPEPGRAAADSEEFVIDSIDPLNREQLSPEELARFTALEAEAARFNARAATNDAPPKASPSRRRRRARGAGGAKHQ